MSLPPSLGEGLSQRQCPAPSMTCALSLPPVIRPGSQKPPNPAFLNDSRAYVKCFESHRAILSPAASFPHPHLAEFRPRVTREGLARGHSGFQSWKGPCIFTSAARAHTCGSSCCSPRSFSWPALPTDRPLLSYEFEHNGTITPDTEWVRCHTPARPGSDGQGSGRSGIQDRCATCSHGACRLMRVQNKQMGLLRWFSG